MPDLVDVVIIIIPQLPPITPVAAPTPPPAIVTVRSSVGITDTLFFVAPGVEKPSPLLASPASATVLSTTYWWLPNANQISWKINESEHAAVGIPPASTGAAATSTTTVASVTPSNRVGDGLQPIPADTSRGGPSSTSTSSAVNTSSTNTATGQTSNPKGSGGLSSGAVAGVAIGCLLAGALIAGLIFWFCCGKRRSSPARDSESRTHALVSQEKGSIVKSIPLGNGGYKSSPLGSDMPQPLEDEAISGEISKISNLIKNHVQSYYHTGRVNTGLIDSDDIQALGSDFPVSFETFITLLGNPAMREIALRFCIAWVVVSRMQPHKEPSKNFLPLHASGCFQEIVNANSVSKSHASLTARWRAITAELLQSTYIRNPFAPSDSRNASIQAALNDLENILLPFTDSRMDNGQRRRNLEEILKRSALFAFTLFSQPSSWEFDWKDFEGGARSGGLCIFPALVQATDEIGEPVRPPRPFSEAVVRRLDE